MTEQMHAASAPLKRIGTFTLLTMAILFLIASLLAGCAGISFHYECATCGGIGHEHTHSIPTRVPHK